MSDVQPYPSAEMERVLASLREILSAVATIAALIPTSDGTSMQERANVLGKRVGDLATAESERHARIYNIEWDRRHAEEVVVEEQAAEVRVLSLAALARQATLLKYYAERAALVTCPPCAMHDWVSAPPSVAAGRVCRRCPAESSREEIVP